MKGAHDGALAPGVQNSNGCPVTQVCVAAFVTYSLMLGPNEPAYECFAQKADCIFAASGANAMAARYGKPTGAYCEANPPNSKMDRGLIPKGRR